MGDNGGSKVMCRSCWVEAGSPMISSPEIKNAASLAHKVYMFHCTGGGLHIVLDDYNLDDDSVAWCRSYLEERGEDTHWSDESYTAQMECLVAFEGLTEHERYAALALSDGFWNEEDYERREHETH